MSVTHQSDDFGPLRPPPPINAEARRIDGPFQLGDEHPTRPNWFYTGKFDEQGNPLWYRPTARWRRKAVVIGLTAMVALFYFIAGSLLIFRPPDDPGVGWVILALAVVTHVGAVHELKEPVNLPRGVRSRSWW